MASKILNIKMLSIIPIVWPLFLYLPNFLGSASTLPFDKCHSLGSPSLRPRQMVTLQNKNLLLILLDFDDFMCMNCLDSFLSFYRSIPPPILEENAWAVLVIDPGNTEKQAQTTLKIAQKKLRGFVKTHRIPFPIIIDAHNTFKPLAKNGTSVYVFDHRMRSVSLWTFPLSRSETDEILSLLLDNDGH